MKGKWLCLVMALFAISLCAIIPPEYAPMPIANDPELVQGTLPNGLKYVIMRNAKPANRIELRLIVDAGSVQEDDDQLGLAHFCEHMAFNGSKNFPRTEMVEYLSSIGMGFHNGLNGGTSYDWTVYMFKLPTDDLAKLRKGFSILSDIAWQLSFDPSEIERERGIVQEEWRLGQSADRRVSDRISQVRFAGSRYAERNPIGTIENLKIFTHESLIRFYKDWYRPDLQTVLMVGDYDPLEMEAMVKEYFGVIPKRETTRPKERYPIPDNADPRSIVALDKELTYSTAQATWKNQKQPVVDLGSYYQNLKQQLFYTMFSARMQEISMKPDPPFSYAYGFNSDWLKEFSASMLLAICTEGRSEDAMRTLLQETIRIRQHGFQEGEFERAKLELVRNAETAVAEKPTRESEELIWSLLIPLIRGESIISPEQDEALIKTIVNEIGLDEVNDIVDEMITRENLTLSISGTEKEGAVYPSESRLLTMLDELANTPQDPWVDTVVDEPIMEILPTPGKITRQSVYPKSGIKKWVLSNGITVYSKQTDFQADEVLLTAISPGGKALLSRDEAKTTDMLSMYLMGSGFGKFDGPALQKALAGKVASASASVGINSERVMASCSPKDMELMFQLVYQMAHSPRFNEESFATTKTRLASFVQNNLMEPQSAFFDTLFCIIYNNHPLKRQVLPQDLEVMTLARLEKAYRERFGDFSDFSFVVVGAFDEELLMNYCTTYLANLPTVKRKDKIVNTGITTFSGQKTVKSNKGLSDRAFASFVTKGKYSYAPKDVIGMDALMVVAGEKLRENVRENLSGVYVVAIWDDSDRYPKPEYTITTWMGCDPEKVDMLNNATLATLDSLKLGLFDDKYVQTAKSTLGKTYEDNIKTNRYWVDSVSTNLFYGNKIDSFLNYPSLYTKLDKKTIIKAAKQYLSFDKHKLSVIMLPEGEGK